ncbi:hypothetical protein V9T40_007392 [Parthenolecanium corni]|uniref:Uncharacterized protein n=1 Tax=Parthenolecanium corni TaxID=536013 RepID=A0AAN9U3J3_9HEMI
MRRFSSARLKILKEKLHTSNLMTRDRQAGWLARGIFTNDAILSKKILGLRSARSRNASSRKTISHSGALAGWPMFELPMTFRLADGYWLANSRSEQKVSLHPAARSATLLPPKFGSAAARTEQPPRRDTAAYEALEWFMPPSPPNREAARRRRLVADPGPKVDDEAVVVTRVAWRRGGGSQRRARRCVRRSACVKNNRCSAAAVEGTGWRAQKQKQTGLDWQMAITRGRSDAPPEPCICIHRRRSPVYERRGMCASNRILYAKLMEPARLHGCKWDNEDASERGENGVREKQRERVRERENRSFRPTPRESSTQKEERVSERERQKARRGKGNGNRDVGEQKISFQRENESRAAEKRWIKGCSETAVKCQRRAVVAESEVEKRSVGVRVRAGRPSRTCDFQSSHRVYSPCSMPGKGVETRPSEIRWRNANSFVSMTILRFDVASSNKRLIRVNICE